jgi:predicted nucleic acid-binding protein
VTLLCDTSGLIAYFDSGDAHHSAVAAAVGGDPGPFVVSPYVLAELDYLVSTRRGVDAELAALQELAGGAWDLAACDEDDVRRAAEVVGRYADQQVGLADASVAILADRYGTDRVLTLDRRHFLVLRTLDGRPFTLLPG